MASVLFTVGIVAFLLFWFGASYRRILHLRILVSHGWQRLDDLVKQRIEIIGRTLVVAENAGITGAEIDRLAHLHAHATPYRGPAEAGHRNREIDQASSELVSLMGQHPGMSDTLRAIGDELNSVATAVTTARETYNQRAATYNRAIGVLPGNLIAGMAGFHRAENF